MPHVRGMVAEVWSENDRSRIFLNASRLALKDGQLSNGEKRILVKLAHALSLEDGEPKRIYDAILSGEWEEITGEKIEKSEMRLGAAPIRMDATARRWTPPWYQYASSLFAHSGSAAQSAGGTLKS